MTPQGGPNFGNVGPHIEEVTIDPKLPEAIQDKIIKAEVQNAERGRLYGVLIVLIGVLLTLVGATGAVDLRLGGFGLDARVANAAPGVVLMIIGLVVIVRSNLSIKSGKGK